MPKIYAFYNPLAGNGSCKEDVNLLELIYDDEIIYCDMTQPETYETQLFALQPEDFLILCGGDGTVNRFLNLVQDTPIACDILLFPLGRRNNFARFLGHRYGDVPFSIKERLMDSPSISTGNRALRFVWGVEFELSDHRFGRQMCAATIDAAGISHRFKRRQLETTRHSNTQLLLQGRKAHRTKPKGLLSAGQISFRFDRPVTVLADGEIIGQAKNCAVTITKR